MLRLCCILLDRANAVLCLCRKERDEKTALEDQKEAKEKKEILAKKEKAAAHTEETLLQLKSANDLAISSCVKTKMPSCGAVLASQV